MKSSIKDIVIGVFAVIGFYTVVTAFNSPQTEPILISSIPESHRWEMATVSDDAFLYNKVTGEVRAMGDGPDRKGIYVVLKEE